MTKIIKIDSNDSSRWINSENIISIIENKYHTEIKMIDGTIYYSEETAEQIALRILE